MLFIPWSSRFMLPFILASLVVLSAFAQVSHYVSPEDNELTFDQIQILNFDDTSGGAYAKPLMDQAVDFFGHDRRFQAERSALPSLPLTDLEDNPKDLAADAKLHPRRAYLKTRLVKGPQGIHIRTILFTGPQARPLIVSEKIEDHFELESIKQSYQQELTKILNSLPYQAFVLSRRQNQVTINAGSLQGLSVNQELLVVQVIHIEHHPKLHFATQFQREIMGKIKLTKVEESLSFGKLMFEKTSGLIAPDFKITFHESVSYDGDDMGVAGEGADKDAAKPIPTFGEAQILGGLSKLSAQNNLITRGSVSAEDSTTPTFLLKGEVWLTPNWYSQLSLQEYIGHLTNGLAGSTPSPLSTQVQRVTFHAGYRFLMQDDFFGPSVNVGLGYSKTKFSVSDSTPTALTSQDYSSVALVVGGKFPIRTDGGKNFYLGADFLYHLSPSLSESPASSGNSSSSQIASLDFYGLYPIKPNVYAIGMVQFDQFNTNFSGTGGRSPESATSSSLNFLSALGGVVFQF